MHAIVILVSLFFLVSCRVTNTIGLSDPKINDTSSLSLSLVAESKLKYLFDQNINIDKWEASGIDYSGGYLYVVLDNTTKIAKISLENGFDFTDITDNQIIEYAIDDIEGFEGIDSRIDSSGNVRIELVVESMTYQDGNTHGLIIDGTLLKKEQKLFLGTPKQTKTFRQFKSENKGYEGIATRVVGEKTYVYAICEGGGCKGSNGKDQPAGIDVYVREYNTFKLYGTIDLPDQIYLDYSGLDIEEDRLAIVSQEDKSVSIYKLTNILNAEFLFTGKLPGQSNNGYCNLEGVSFIDKDHIALVSDRKKSSQPKICNKKDESVHIYRWPISIY